jgi:hypothetical protein
MATDIEQEKGLKSVEEAALEHIAEESGHVEEQLEEAAAAVDLEPGTGEERWIRPALAVALTVVAAAVMTGGVFQGTSPRFYAGVAGVLGIGLALGAARIRRPLLANVLIIAGLFAIGILMVLPDGFADVASIRSLVTSSIASGKVLRPPAPFTPGWAAMLGWIMGTIGFGAAWLATVMRRPSIAVLLPLPLAAIAGISVPHDDQVVSGLAVMVLFVAGLGVLSGSQLAGDEELPRGYELRRALKALPVVAVITGVLAVLALQTTFLFPHPFVDPTLEPQKPKAIPLGEVKDRVLFDVESSITGPWVLGHLDVYDGQDWRLPPFAENAIKPVPSSGLVDRDLQPGAKATFTIEGLDGAVLPDLGNTVGVIAEGPKIAYDARSGNLRLVEGQVQRGFKYTVVAAGLPDVASLTAMGGELKFPTDVQRFAQIPPPPHAVLELMKKAPQDSQWKEFDYLRTYILVNVTAAGSGPPVSVTPQRVEEMLTTKKEATPYEIVAAQAMMARWIGLPSRIGYGFDGGEKVGAVLQVHPKDGITFPEVYFPGYKWLPVIGTPLHARVTEGGKSNVQQNVALLPSEDISVPLYLPTLLPPEVQLYETVRQVLVILVPILLILALAYVTFPALLKAIGRARRRAAAAAAGPRAQVALAYAEWRDYTTDFGYRFPTDTPLMFLDRFVPDQEHSELAWLVTRVLWGDLQDRTTPQLAADAEELSRGLRRRLAQTQPITMRTVALFSRLSLRHPFDPEVVRVRPSQDSEIASAAA